MEIKHTSFRFPSNTSLHYLASFKETTNRGSGPRAKGPLYRIPYSMEQNNKKQVVIASEMNLKFWIYCLRESEFHCQNWAEVAILGGDPRWRSGSAKWRSFLGVLDRHWRSGSARWRSFLGVLDRQWRSGSARWRSGWQNRDTGAEWSQILAGSTVILQSRWKSKKWGAKRIASHISWKSCYIKPENPGLENFDETCLDWIGSHVTVSVHMYWHFVSTYVLTLWRANRSNPNTFRQSFRVLDIPAWFNTISNGFAVLCVSRLIFRLSATLEYHSGCYRNLVPLRTRWALMDSWAVPDNLWASAAAPLLSCCSS